MKCKYCGLDAGLFSRAHDACKEKHRQGMDDLLDELQADFMGRVDMASVLKRVKAVKSSHYLSQEDVEDCCRKSIDCFANTLRLPITKTHMQLIDQFLHHIGISSTLLNKEGALDRLGKRFYQGVLMSYFVDNEALAKVEKRAQLVSGLFPLTCSVKEFVGLEVLDKAAQKYLEDGLISDSEQAKLDDFTQSFNLPVNNLPAKFVGNSIEKVQQSVILRDLQNGVLPTVQSCALPVILSNVSSI